MKTSSVARQPLGTKCAFIAPDAPVLVENANRPQLRVHVSFAPALQSFVKEAMQAIPLHIQEAELIITGTQTEEPQMRHLLILVNHMLADDFFTEESIPSTWIMFTDSDDIWHPNRTDVFRQLIAAATKETTFVAMKIFVMGDSDEHISTAKDVSAITSANPDRNITDTGVYELWKVAVPFEVLYAFGRDAPLELVQHKCADLYFIKYFASQKVLTGEVEKDL
eukprot:11399-Heterococcus_DN1.PRE.5